MAAVEPPPDPPPPPPKVVFEGDADGEGEALLDGGTTPGLSESDVD